MPGKIRFEHLVKICSEMIFFISGGLSIALSDDVKDSMSPWMCLLYPNALEAQMCANTDSIATECTNRSQKLYSQKRENACAWMV